jgi:hypothetical protein
VKQRLEELQRTEGASDVVVVGGGYAGIELASVAAEMLAGSGNLNLRARRNCARQQGMCTAVLWPDSLMSQTHISQATFHLPRRVLVVWCPVCLCHLSVTQGAGVSSWWRAVLTSWRPAPRGSVPRRARCSAARASPSSQTAWCGSDSAFGRAACLLDCNLPCFCYASVHRGISTRLGPQCTGTT